MKESGRPLGLIRRAILGVSLAIPFVLAFFISVEIWLRLTTNLPFASRTRCFVQNKVEAPGFLPDCEEVLRNPKESFSFRTNEFGFRDRPRAFFEKGAIAVLGDSYVEGFWLDEERGIVRSLERKLNWNEHLLNLGIRSSGPTQQAIRLFRAWKEFPLKGVIWVLNPSDPLDEILFQIRNPNFEMTRERWTELNPTWNITPMYQRWTQWSVALRDRVYLLLYIAEKMIKIGSQSRLVAGAEFRADQHCRSLKLVADELKAKNLPLLFLAIPHGILEIRRPYLGLNIEEGKFEELLACARETGALMLDLRKELNGRHDWYWNNDWHYNERGVELATDIIAPKIKNLWREKK